MPTPQQEIDIWDRLLVERKRDLMRNDITLTPEEAEDRACAEIRREIRNG